LCQDEAAISGQWLRDAGGGDRYGDLGAADVFGGEPLV